MNLKVRERERHFLWNFRSNNMKKFLPHIAWFTALTATLGSLYFSDVKHFAPCILCWYQRIVMYPLVLIIPIGILKKDKNFSLYTLIFSSIGGLVAIYHELVYYGIIGTVCRDISCITKYIEWGGFITIPFLSLVSFVVIAVCMVIYRYGRQAE